MAVTEEVRDLDVQAVVAARLRALRGGRGLTLDALATASGVSRAMLSRIERGESSPTAGLLVKLCRGLGVTLAALLGGDAARAEGPLARRADQPVWRDSGSGYLRRTISPAGTGSRVHVAEIEMPVGTVVLLDALDRSDQDRHVWMLDGRLEIVHDGDVVSLDRGDCLRVPSDRLTGFRNPGPAAARCAVITGPTGEGGKPT